MNRYKFQGYGYAKYYSVECPDCKKEAIVENNKFYCKHCFKKEEISNTVYYNAEIKLNCPDCGSEIRRLQKHLTSKPDLMSTECPKCGFKLKVRPRIETDYFKIDLNGLKGDPFFGFPLWLQTEIKGNLFWGYNREHLLEIEAYVSSELRERLNYSSQRMLYRLPSFIKDAKNREAISKAIHRMLNR